MEAWSRLTVRWVPSWVEEVSAELFGLIFVYGPGRVGETTGLKRLVGKLIDALGVAKNLFST